MCLPTLSHISPFWRIESIRQWMVCPDYETAIPRTEVATWPGNMECYWKAMLGGGNANRGDLAGTRKKTIFPVGNFCPPIPV
jgi:hypothetical protein